MSSGTLTYPMAAPVNLSMALTTKMMHRRLVMLPVRFLCVHQWTLMMMPDLTVDEHPMPPHVCTPSVSSELQHVHTPSDEPSAMLHVCTPSVS